MTRLTENQVAPPFTLPNQFARPVSLAQFAPQRVVLYFYPADDTPGCTAEATEFQELLDDFLACGARVVGVSADAIETHRAFAEAHHLTFDLLSDPPRRVMTDYGAYGEKMLYGKRVVGVIRSTVVVSAKGTVERAFYNVRAHGHAARVLRAVGELALGD